MTTDRVKRYREALEALNAARAQGVGRDEESELAGDVYDAEIELTALERASIPSLAAFDAKRSENVS